MRAPERLGPYVYRQSDTCFPLGGDSLALAAFASVRRGDRVCDLGCGAGALLLLLAARVSPLVLSGVEYCPEDASLARRNLSENGLEGAICTGDLRAVCKTLPAGGFSLAISNPPYFKAGSGGCGGPARMEGDCALEDWCAAAGAFVRSLCRPPLRRAGAQAAPAAPARAGLPALRRPAGGGAAGPAGAGDSARTTVKPEVIYMAGTLYLVPTPIGNLGDISRRIADTLGEVDFIAAEDTRVTLKLLNHLGLKKPMLSYYRHNTGAGGEAVLGRLLAGESCALVTDAGTPAVSDPGEELVALCAQSGVDVVAIPGPCALVTALAVSGLPTGRFTFEGFLAMNKKNRRTHLEELKGERRTMIFYEAPHKLAATLADLAEVFGPDRPVSLCRELSKLHEEIVRTTLGEAARQYAGGGARGEFVLVVRGAPPRQEAEATLEDGLALVRRLREEEGLSLRDAVRQAARETGLAKNELYDRAVGKTGGCE